MAFRLPSPTYANEWDLVSGVLQELDETTAAGPARGAAARRVRPGGGGRVRERARRGRRWSGSLRDPATRFATLRELGRDDRPFARFVRLFSRTLLWDGEVEEAEREKLRVAAGDGRGRRGGAGPGPAGRSVERRRACGRRWCSASCWGAWRARAGRRRDRRRRAGPRPRRPTRTPSPGRPTPRPWPRSRRSSRGWGSTTWSKATAG